MQAAWMVAASLFFAGMGACIKFASDTYTPLEVVFYRGLISVLVVGVLARSRGVSLRTHVPMMHVWRNVVGVASLLAWFYAIAHLPLSTAITLNYMSGIWIAAFVIGGTLALGKLADVRRQGPLIGTVMLGFGGVVLLLRPTLDQNQLFAGLVGLLGSLMAALAYMQVAALGRVGEPETRTVFYFSLAALVAGAGGMLVFGAHSLATPQALWLLPMGLLGALGQLCMTRAYTHGSTIVVANLQYSGIVFGALLGMTLFGDHIPPLGWLGMALIIACGMAATVLRARALPNPPAEEF
ncbi:DMT family transporter [Ottowia sp.]|uniref:DMT family transporter n=1 Tax=Ottowia sp. TaxID=1898956 RepID=UPI0025D77556|nr:DMT family transporter [Ottowia sp.]